MKSTNAAFYSGWCNIIIIDAIDFESTAAQVDTPSAMAAAAVTELTPRSSTPIMCLWATRLHLICEYYVDKLAKHC